MKALAYATAHALDAFAIVQIDVAEPQLRDTDLLVEIRAVGLNPGEAYIRSVRSAEAGGRVILGWEFAGTVIGVGSAVDAASLPIGGLTAWEAVFRDRDELPAGVDRVLVVGGAGGVGSLAIQLLKVRTSAFVIATASRPQSRDWCQTMGADLVVDHRQDVIAQLNNAGIHQVDMVFSTAGTAENLSWIAELLRPFGHLSAIDIAPPFDVGPLVSKSASLHTEMVFAKIIRGFNLSSQGKVLAEIADHVESGRLRPIVTTRLDGLTAQNMKTAHELLESKRTIGKIVVVV